MTRAAWDATPTDYQARLLLAALDDSQHRIPSDAKTRTLEIMAGNREWIRAHRLTSTLAAVESGAKDYVLTHHGVNAANRVRIAELAKQYPFGSGAVYMPEGATKRDVVVVNSGPEKDGTVEVLSAKQGGQPVRVPLGALQPLPEPTPEPEGEWTEWWTVMDRTGQEVARVKGGELRSLAMKAVERDPVAGPVSRREGGVGLRRLRSSELSIPVGELRGLPRVAPAPRPVEIRRSNGRTATVMAGFTRKSIPTRLREANAPGRSVYSEAAGANRWRLPGGEEITHGEAAKRFLGD
ncbi:hypothetical protein [Streptomyces lanatus]|uniref:Uncharacterized protein n=1 Tax=Streptomyces lanatus TaxID=66900 RepID=A0ABV1Y0A7_9ACTN|nr:hypothetical protein [Streptomyces lanatus]GHH22469.1 hypothetical protein GCM10018780_70970 [Streptomyces lanatus]